MLFVTCHLPFPALSGGRRREHELITRLSDRFEIDICAITKTIEADREHVRAAAEHCRQVSLHEAANSISGTGAPQVQRHASASACAALQQLANRDADYDLVHVEGFCLMQHVPAGCQAPVLLVEQNVEHLLWRQRAGIAEDERSRRELERWAAETHEAERVAWLRASSCATVTEDDRRVMVSDLPSLEVSVVPDGWDHDTTLPHLEPPTAPPASAGATGWSFGAQPGARLLMVGNFGYQPNVDAALHLLGELFPRILASVPEAQLTIVGADPPRELLDAVARTGKAHVTGPVPAIHPYLDEASVVVCPLRVGGGIKVKVLEALARGCAVVSSTVGAQGLPKERGGIRVADAPQEFADAVTELLRSPHARAKQRLAARRLAATLPTWEQAAHSLADCYETLIERPVVRAA